MRILFIKHFIAKAFHWTPDVLERISADDLDALIYIEGKMQAHEKEEMERNNRQMKARSGM